MFSHLSKITARRATLAGIAVGILLLALAVHAQEPASRSLSPGKPEIGTLDANNIAQVYNFQATQGQAINLTIVNQSGAVLGLLVSDAVGNPVEQHSDIAANSQDSYAITPTQTGTYYVMVFPFDRGSATGALSFQLTLQLPQAAAATPSATPSVQPQATLALPPLGPGATAEATVEAVQPGQVLTNSGLQITLSWGSKVDLDLEVRDPVGGSLYWRTPTVNSGGTLGPNANQVCASATTSPSEAASWPAGGLPTGSYEVLVYYQQACEGQDPVPATVNITFNGTSLPPAQETMSLGQVYITSFIVRADGTAAPSGLSGIDQPNDLPAAAANVLESAKPIQADAPLTGTITDQQPYESFSFDAQANDSVTINLDAYSGSLDPYVFLIDSTGAILDRNDDREQGNTNSTISNHLITQAGTYTIVATRYGQGIGGTEGNFTVTLSTQSAALPPELQGLPVGSLEMRLTWASAADLRLLVRDPAGDSAYTDTPVIPSGGKLVATGNLNCPTPAATNPLSEVYWPPERAPRAGSYEVEVWTQSQCNDTTPVQFTLYILQNGRQVFSDTQQPLPSEKYLMSFTINTDGSLTAGPAGIINGVASLDYQSQLATAPQIVSGEQRTGNITPDHKFDVYSFQGQQGQVVSIAMNETAGSLDPVLYLLDQNGIQIATNDDTAAGDNINSLISEFTLPEDGAYYIIATHFGALYGGTTGTYTLTYTQQG